MNAIKHQRTSTDHTYAHTKPTQSLFSPAHSTTNNGYESSSSPIVPDYLFDEGEETLKADAFDEAKNEVKLVGSLMRQIFMNQGCYRDEYSKQLNQFMAKEKEWNTEKAAKDAEIERLSEELASAYYENEKIKTRMDEMHSSLSTALEELRNSAYDVYLVTHYAFEKFFNRFNKIPEYEHDGQKFSKMKKVREEILNGNDEDGENENGEPEDAENNVGEVENVSEEIGNDENDQAIGNDEDDHATEDSSDEEVEMLLSSDNESSDDNEVQYVGIISPPSINVKSIKREKKLKKKGEKASKKGETSPKERKTNGKRTKRTQLREEAKPKSKSRVIHPKPNVMRMFDNKIKRVPGCKECLKIDTKKKLLVHLQEYHKMSPVMNKKLCYSDFNASLRGIGNTSSTVKVADHSNDNQRAKVTVVTKMQVGDDEPSPKFAKRDPLLKTDKRDPSPKSGKRKLSGSNQNDGSRECGAGSSAEKKKKRNEQENVATTSKQAFIYVLTENPSVRKANR